MKLYYILDDNISISLNSRNVANLWLNIYPNLIKSLDQFYTTVLF